MTGYWGHGFKVSHLIIVPPEKESPLCIGIDAGWASELVWMSW